MADLVHPPAYGRDGEVAQRTSFSLLEKYAYFDSRENATTAVCDLEKGSIQVTFCAAQPPRASYFCVHATHFAPARFGAAPQILATEGPLALLRVIIGPRKSYFSPAEGDLFVYHAGGDSSEGRRPPSLRRLPSPAPHFFGDSYAAIVRYCPRRDSAQRRPGGLSAFVLRPHRRGIKEEEEGHDCGYVIAALRCSTARYELCRYHSKTGTWSAPEPLMVADQDHTPYPSGSQCKALTIGGEGGTVAWATLGKHTRRIVFCDVLAITDTSPRPPVLHFLHMPPGMESPEESTGCLQDIDFVDGSIAYIELQLPEGEYAWEANTWRIKIDRSLPLSYTQWKWERTFGSSDISKSLRDRLDVGGADAVFYVGPPILSLRDDGVVYILTKTDPEDRYKSWLLAIDMKKKKVQQVQELDGDRGFFLFRAYFTTTRISKYIQVNPGTGKQKPKRQKMVPLQRHSCEKLHGVSMVSHWQDDMELDVEVDYSHDTPSLPEPVVKPPLTQEQLEGEREEACKPYQIPQSQGSVAPAWEREVEEASKKKPI